MNSLERLVNIGFQEVGHFFYTENRKHNLDVEIPNFIEKKCLYAFVVNKKVKYVGTTEQFKERIGFYCTGNPSQSTNRRIHEEIHNCLKDNSEVKIYAYKPKIDFEIKIKGIDIDLVKGLEYGIITEMKKINDLWNLKNRWRKINEILGLDLQVPPFLIKLGKFMKEFIDTYKVQIWLERTTFDCTEYYFQFYTTGMQEFTELQNNFVKYLQDSIKGYDSRSFADTIYSKKVKSYNNESIYYLVKILREVPTQHEIAFYKYLDEKNLLYNIITRTIENKDGRIYGKI